MQQELTAGLFLKAEIIYIQQTIISSGSCANIILFNTKNRNINLQYKNYATAGDNFSPLSLCKFKFSFNKNSSSLKIEVRK